MTKNMIEPVGHFVLIEMKRIEEKTAGGIILPQTAVEKEERAAHSGKVIATGPLCKKLDALGHGRTAFFGRYAGMLLDHDGAEYRLIDEDEIRGVL